MLYIKNLLFQLLVGRQGLKTPRNKCVLLNILLLWIFEPKILIADCAPFRSYLSLSRNNCVLIDFPRPSEVRKIALRPWGARKVGGLYAWVCCQGEALWLGWIRQVCVMVWFYFSCVKPKGNYAFRMYVRNMCEGGIPRCGNMCAGA